MVRSCWICKTSGSDTKKSYFRIPKILTHRNSKVFQLSVLRKEKWQKILVLPDDVSGIRICSDHFLSGSPAKLLDLNDPDWIPTQNLVKVSKINNSNGQIVCRLCLKTCLRNSTIDIFDLKNKKILRLVSIVLGHKVVPDEGKSNFVCEFCIKKIVNCTRLIRFFRKNEVAGSNIGVLRQNEEKIEKVVSKTWNNANGSGNKKPGEITLDNSEKVQSESDFILNEYLYDKDQIHSIIEDNSMSSVEEENVEEIIKTKRRKYECEKVKIRPTEIKTLKCNDCYQKFNDINELMLHKNFCKLYHCQICKPQVSFCDKVSLLQHKRELHCNPLMCHICGKSYSPTYLVKHFKNHFENKKECPFCGKILKNVTLMMLHIDRTHGDRSKILCDVCGGLVNNLKSHVSNCNRGS